MSDLAARKSSFAPVADVRTRLLILGSLPGEQSLARNQYYANPQNQFWRLMESVTCQALVDASYAERLERLLASGVGLWDVVRSAARAGSLDTNIRDHQANALPDLCCTLPGLRAVAFNGGKASALGRKVLEHTRLDLVTLPSSSPAHTRAFDSKRAEWMDLQRFLA